MNNYTIFSRGNSASAAYSIQPEPITSLWFLLHTIPDPRRAQGRRHPLPIVLALALLAVSSGYHSYEAMEEWCVNYQEIVEQEVPVLAGHTPNASTFHRVFAHLDSTLFEEILSQWITTIAASQEYEGIALDGKTIGCSGIHMVAAFAHEARSVLFEKHTTTKGKELVVGPDVLNHLQLRNRIITGDAMFAQKKICQLLVKKQAGFVYTVKDNQRTLKESIEHYFTNPPWGASIETDTTSEKNKGRVEYRRLEVTTELNDYLDDWPGITHVWRITRTVMHHGQQRTEHAVGIARLPARSDISVSTWLLQLIRNHWQIEIRLHRQRDVCFGEDRCGIRSKQAPAIMAAVRNIVLTIFHLTRVRSFPAAFRRFSSHPRELFHVFGFSGKTQFSPISY